MSLGKRLINTGAEAACLTETTDIFGDSSGVALYSLDYDASTAPDGTDYSGSPTNVDFGVGGQINYGARFNGSSSYIDVPSGVRQNNNFTFSFWFNTNSTTLGQNAVSFRDGKKFQIGLNNSNVGNGSIRVNAGNNTAVDSATGIFSANTWYHLAVTQSSTGGVKVYLNGSVIASNSGATGDLVSVTGRDVIGAYYSTSYIGFFNGKIDQVRMFSKALSSDEVDTLYAETACVHTSTTDIVNYPTGTTPVAYYKLDNSSEDYSTGGNDGTDTNIEYRFGRFGQAAVFNGSSSRINISSLSLFDRSSFAISCWVKSTNVTSTGRVISHEDNGGSAIIIRGDDVIIDARDAGASASTTLTMSTTNNQWHHVCLVNDSNYYYLYLDGLLVDSDNYGYNPTSATAASGHQLAFGYRKINNDSYWSGDLDQVRIYDAALTSSQVTELYNEKPEVDTSNFKTVLWEGNGNDNRYISNLGIDLETDGGLVWTKTRTAAYYHQLQDSVRGAGANAIYSNSTDAENGGSSTYNADFGYINSFEANGWFTKNGSDGLGTWVNRSGNDYVAWVWKGGGDDVLNEEGTIDSQVSANTDAGFSIVKFDGYQSSGTTVGHGLNIDGVATTPELIIAKNLDQATSWPVWFDDAITMTSTTFTLENSTKYLALNSATGYLSFTLDRQFGGTLSGGSGDEMIAYCFHSVSGYSKIGSYSGSSSSQRIYVTNDGTSSGSGGFEPSWVMIKRTDSVAANWIIYDKPRGNGDIELYPDSSSNESNASSVRGITFQSDGFTLDNSHSQYNASGVDFIYMAFK